MAITNNLLLSNLSGQLGRQLVFKQYRGKTVVSKYPDMSRRKFSAKQKQTQDIMVEANLYTKTILADQQKKMDAQVRLNVTSNRLYTALIKEYFTNVSRTTQPAAEKKTKTQGKSR